MPTEVEFAETAQVESARRRKTRDRLIDAAYEVFAETGVHAASVEMITERAGFTRGAFYSNFDTKEELFFALAERENRIRFERLQEGVDAILPDVDPAAVRFVDLHNWVLALDGFDDDRTRGGEKVLEAIQMAWIDEAR